MRAFGEVRDAERSQRHSRVNHPLQTDGYLAEYYARRAPEMEEAFECTGRAADVAHLQRLLPEMVEGLDVVEIACGTGFWTQFMAERVRSITATDINEEMLGLARAKTYPGGRATFRCHDAYHLSRLPGVFNAAVGLFWWSHVPHFRLRTFLAEVNRTLAPGSLVIFVDNLPEDCRRTPTVGVDADGNLYQRRVLRSGEDFEIIKNYPSRRRIMEALRGLAVEPRYTALDCLWLLSYRTRK